MTKLTKAQRDYLSDLARGPVYGWPLGSSAAGMLARLVARGLVNHKPATRNKVAVFTISQAGRAALEQDHGR